MPCLLLLLMIVFLYEAAADPLVIPASMPWPFPNDAKMSTGTTTVQLSHDFTITTAKGPTSPDLTAAMLRYQNQAVGSHVVNPQGKTGAPVLSQLIVQVCLFFCYHYKHNLVILKKVHTQPLSMYST